MLAVSDTSPLCYLILIGCIDLLPRFFDEIVVPQAVVAELLHPDTPGMVRAWHSNPPAWLNVRALSHSPSAELDRLDPGEREAIALATELNAGRVLLDDNAARRAAGERDLHVVGVLGLLLEAGARGWLDFADAIARLRETTFRASPALWAAVASRQQSSST